MARYCIVTDLTMPRPSVIMVHYELRNGTESEYDVEEAGTHGFQIRTTETVTQNRARLQAETDAYFGQIIALSDAVEEHFPQLQADALGYRYPPAEG